MSVSQIVTYRELLQSPDADQACALLERVFPSARTLPIWVHEKGVRAISVDVWPLWESRGWVEDVRNIHLCLIMEGGKERRNRTDILTLYRTTIVHREAMGLPDEWEACVSAVCALVLAG